MSEPHDSTNPEASADTASPRAVDKAPAAAAREPGPPREERRTRALISLGVGLTLSGIALSVADGSVARWLVVGGVVIAFVALHRYGRLGPQAV
jgi:hypothetical protein